MNLSGRNWRVLIGDVLDVLRTLPDESVQCAVTSPPYFGLRDYGTGTWEGGDETCDHMETSVGMSTKNTLGPNGRLPESNAANVGRKTQFKGKCGKCGARRIDRQIGLEKTPDEFVAKLVEVFHEVRRVLRSDGVCFVNIGDSYNAGTSATRKASRFTDVGRHSDESDVGNIRTNCPGLKPKDLIGIPWRLALAMQSDGWYWRDCIVWHKRSPMPESVTDRCTKAWEPIFMFTKSARYFWDQEAVKEESIQAGRISPMGPNSMSRGQAIGAGVPMSGNAFADAYEVQPHRNLRNVWTLSSEPYAEAHFATFPSEIPRRCIKAGTSEKGCCPKCGAPWVRVTEKTKLKRERPNDLTKRTGAEGTGNHCGNTVAGVAVKTTGWEPSCECGIAETVPCVVLDPFSGSGTTGMVATELGREYIGIELNRDYAAMSAKRIESWKYRDVEKPPAPLPGQKELFHPA